MIRPGAIVMTVLMTAVAVGVYFGLDYLPKDMVPGMGKQKEQTAAKPEDGKPLLEGPGTAVATAQVDRVASGVEDPITPGAADSQSAVVTEEDLAEEPPATPPAPAPTASPPSAASTVDYDPAPGGTGVPVEEEIADTPAASATAPASTPAPEPEPGPVAEAPPVEKPVQKPAKLARAPAANDPPRQPVKPKSPEADLIKPWWPDPAIIPANQLKLQYAGQVQNEQAIALLFSAPLNLDTLKQHAEVRDSTGTPVAGGEWALAKNPRMAVLRGVKPGRYTVVLAPAIADTGGYLLGTALQGPVYIQAQ